jgi:hypothetical protein
MKRGLERADYDGCGKKRGLSLAQAEVRPTLARNVKQQ